MAVPITAPGEAGLLSDAGATEFYCGVQAGAWRDAFGNHDSISRRQGSANLATPDELNALVSETSALNAPLYLTLNGSYTREQIDAVAELAGCFEEMGGTGVMAADIELLLVLREKKSKLVRGLSLLAACGSISAAKFYAELGISRLVFPRYLNPAQMAVILRELPDVQAECVIWLDKCRCIDGYCRFLHPVGYRDCPDKTAHVEQIIRTYDTTYRLPACFELFGKPSHLPACAACSMHTLTKAGISVFKMGGRGRSLETRLSGIRFLSEAFRHGDHNAIRKLYEQSFGAPCHPDVCYYEQEHA